MQLISQPAIVSPSIRRANLDLDRTLLAEALGRWLPRGSDSRRFDWLYLNNPHGQAHVWLATDGEDGRLIGAAAAFPRLMRHGNELKKACVLGDFFVIPGYRTLGPAVQLQRACLNSVTSRVFDFCYDFPAAAMLPVYKRLSLVPSEMLVRFVKPLRSDRKIREWVKNPSLATQLSSIANGALSLRDWFVLEGRRHEVSAHSGPCTDEFTELDISVSERYGLHTERSASYLNWRFKNHYSVEYELLTARGKNGQLLGYLVYTCASGEAEIVDLFGVNDAEVLSTLISSAVDRLRSQGAITVSAPLLASAPWVALFQQLGFHRREGCPVIIHPDRHIAGEGQPTHLHWFLMQGDRES